MKQVRHARKSKEMKPFEMTEQQQKQRNEWKPHEIKGNEKTRRGNDGKMNH